MKNIEKLLGYKNYTFSTGSTTGYDFLEFAKMFKKFVGNNLPQGAKLVKFCTGHYRLSGFIEAQGKYVYFSIPDVRYFPNEWITHFLVRRTESDEDYTGKTNHYTTLKKFTEDVNKLLNSKL